MNIQMHSSEGHDHINVETVSARSEGVPSVEVQVELAVQGFCGKATVFLDRNALSDFVKSLDHVERTRKGRADLAPYDQDFRLSVSAMDEAGHLLTEVMLVRNALVGDRGKPVQLKVSGGFELDPGTLPRLVAEFDALGRWSKGQ